MIPALHPLAVHASEPFEAVLEPAERVVVRDVADGAGPSHVFTLGDYVLVVDPWNREIRRYLATDMQRAPAICLFDRTFAPGRIVRQGDAVRIVAEPFGPEAKGGGYALRERAAMTITLDQVAAMPIMGPCRFAVGTVTRADSPPRIHSPGAEAQSASWPLSQDHRAVIAPQAGAGSSVFAVRDAGPLSGNRRLLWWSEVGTQDRLPAEAPPGQAIPAMAGRLVASQYVGVFEPSGNAPVVVIRIDIANVPPLVANRSIPVSTLLEKPGLEFIAGGAGPRGDAIWVVAANRSGPGRGRFELQRYDLADLGEDPRARIALVTGHHETEPLVDREDPAPGIRPEEADVAPPRSHAIPGLAKARATFKAQIAYRWRVPKGAEQRPCGGRNKCRVAADDAGVLGHGPAFAHPVRDSVHPEGGAFWVQPRQLVGVAPGEWVQSVPYSIGGRDLADSFAARIGAYASDPQKAPPVGHIGEGMEWQDTQDGKGWKEDRANYPLGIDCSALLARVFDLRVRSTGSMVRERTLHGSDGHTYAVPVGPDRGCPAPVQSFADLQPGDILLRNGHVVIFDGFTTIGQAPGRSRAMRVFEATSRCGAVCESVYDPTFFAGWWMLRLDRGDNCPMWLGSRTQVEDDRRAVADNS